MRNQLCLPLQFQISHVETLAFTPAKHQATAKYITNLKTILIKSFVCLFVLLANIAKVIW